MKCWTIFSEILRQVVANLIGINLLRMILNYLIIHNYADY